MAQVLARPIGLAALIAASAIPMAEPAAAELVVSQLIVEFRPGGSRTSDIEVTNNSPERAYVLVEPRELINPGTPAEQRVSVPDPGKLGLLVSPARFILEPKQRRTLRIALIGTPAEKERVYRVMVKPVVGELAGSESGLKLLVGYDLLVLARPSSVRSDVKVKRNGTELSFTNSGNASVELAAGKQCDAQGANCKSLPAKRLYAGATWNQTLPREAGGEYRIRFHDGWSTIKFQ